jgi:hypothetical protein
MTHCAHVSTARTPTRTGPHLLCARRAMSASRRAIIDSATADCACGCLRTSKGNTGATFDASVRVTNLRMHIVSARGTSTACITTHLSTSTGASTRRQKSGTAATPVQMADYISTRARMLRTSFQRAQCQTNVRNASSQLEITHSARCTHRNALTSRASLLSSPAAGVLAASASMPSARQSSSPVCSTRRAQL